MTSHTPADQGRVPAGVPTGGQFAATARSEAAVTLDASPATLDDATKAYAAAINDRGPAEQIAYLTQIGLTDEEIRAWVEHERKPLADLVTDETHQTVRMLSDRDTIAPADLAETINRYRFPLRQYDDRLVEDVHPRRMAPDQAVRVTLRDPFHGEKAGNIEAVVLYEENDFVNPATGNPLAPGRVRQGKYTILTEDGSRHTGETIAFSDEVVGRGVYERDEAYCEAVALATRHTWVLSERRINHPLADLMKEPQS